MKNQNHYLITQGNIFGSPLDEEMMFRWLDKIPSVAGYSGQGTELHIQLKQATLDEESLRELVSLFFRYQLDLFQLKQFETEQNKRWFHNADAYWYSYVFEDKSQIPLFGEEGKIWWHSIKDEL